MIGDLDIKPESLALQATDLDICGSIHHIYKYILPNLLRPCMTLTYWYLGDLNHCHFVYEDLYAIAGFGLISSKMIYMYILIHEIDEVIKSCFTTGQTKYKNI